MSKFRLFTIMYLFLIAGAISIFLIPYIDKSLNPGAEQPGLITFTGVGTLLILVTSGFLYFGIRNYYPQLWQFLLPTILYNSIIIFSKFTLSPFSIYQANKDTPFRFGFNPNNFLYWVMVGITICVLYSIPFFLFKLFYTKKFQKMINQSRENIAPKKNIIPKKLVIIFIIIFVLIGPAGAIFLSPLGIGIIYSLDYSGILLSTFSSYYLSLSLIFGLYSLKKSFASATEQAIALRTYTLISLTMWIGISFLIAYHFLWIVYFLLLTTLWPLKVVTSK